MVSINIDRLFEPQMIRAAVVSDSKRLSPPATKVLTSSRPELSYRKAQITPFGEDTMIEPIRRAAAEPQQSLRAAYLVLVERAGRAAFSRGPQACGEFVAAVRGQLAANDDPSERLRAMVPEVALAELAAGDMLRLRCKTCPTGCEERDR